MILTIDRLKPWCLIIPTAVNDGMDYHIVVCMEWARVRVRIHHNNDFFFSHQFISVKIAKGNWPDQPFCFWRHTLNFEPGLAIDVEFHHFLLKGKRFGAERRNRPQGSSLTRRGVFSTFMQPGDWLPLRLAFSIRSKMTEVSPRQQNEPTVVILVFLWPLWWHMQGLEIHF